MFGNFQLNSFYGDGVQDLPSTFDPRVSDEEGILSRLRVEEHDLNRSLADAEISISHGPPASYSAGEWRKEMETLRDELDHQISVLKGKQERLQVEALRLSLEWIEQNGAYASL